MTLLRRLGYASVAIAFLHIVFGAIVRITGSGMGCGDHWPTCYGYWIPPFSRMDLVIEVSHRYLALLLLVVVAALAVAAWRRRAEPGIGGRGGVLRASGLALLLWIAPALLGALTVFLGNPPSATVAHKALAAALLAVLAVATIRAGGFGARALDGAPSTSKAKRGAWIAAAMAIVAVLLGALTAKLPGAAVACAGFPLCSETSGAPGLAHVQLTHRIVAYLLALHLVGLAIVFARRREPRPLVLASRVGVALVIVQIALAGHMVLGGFPAAVRSAHQATGILIWLTTFVMAYLAGRGAVGTERPQGHGALGPGPWALDDGAGATSVNQTTAPRAAPVVASDCERAQLVQAALGPATVIEAGGAATADVETAVVDASEGIEVDSPVLEDDVIENGVVEQPFIAAQEVELGDDEQESELDLEIATEQARREEERERDEEEREEWERVMALEMAKLEAAVEEAAAAERAVLDEPEPTADSPEELAATAAVLAEELVVADTPAFAQALERAIDTAAISVDATTEETEPAEAPEPEDAPSAEGRAPSAAQPPRKPRLLSMAVIVARGADF